MSQTKLDVANASKFATSRKDSVDYLTKLSLQAGIHQTGLTGAQAALLQKSPTAKVGMNQKVAKNNDDSASVMSQAIANIRSTGGAALGESK